MAGSDRYSELTFIGSRRRLARVVGPIADFLNIEASGGILLLAATAAALVWANSPWDQAYVDLWRTDIQFEIGSFRVREDLLHAVNDGLMTLFFFVVGLEIKRELVTGELRDPRAAAVPALAALGGMVVPAGLYVAITAGGAGSAGWGIPMATDIAFAVGVLALFGDRLPGGLKVFLLTLAIVDDIGAIAVIAVFYTDDLSTGWLLVAFALFAGTWALKRARVWYVPVYVILGVALWFATFESGVHATIAGVALGLLTPARPLRHESADAALDPARDDDGSAHGVRRRSFLIRETVSVAERLEDALHPWTSYLVIPVFALANAGIALSGDAIGDAAGSAVTLGIVVGLVAGKTVGVSLATAVAVSSGLGRLPDGVRRSHVIGVAAMAGIGFTVSLFITGLAFDDPVLEEQAKIGILVASVGAAVLGAGILAAANRTDSGSPPAPAP